MEGLFNIDGNILLFIQEFIRNPLLNPIIIFITSLGDGGKIWIIATLALMIPEKTRKAGMMSALALLGSLLINNCILKELVARPRPYTALEELIVLIPKPGEYSFPSGHTSSSFASAMVFYRQFPKKWGIWAVVLASLIGLSRLYVGVHYPTDVLAGAVTGTLLALLAEFVLNKVSSYVHLENLDG